MTETEMSTEIERLSLDLHEARETIAGLRKERDALREALKKYASPENWEQDEHGWSRLWLEPDSTSRRSYDGSELAFAALAQGEV